ISSITNTGSVSALAGNVNISAVTSGLAISNAAAALSAVNLNNAGGTISALKGDINLGDPLNETWADINVIGGNLLSKNLNIYAGQGTANVLADQVTGVVNTSGAAAHIGADTKNLVLGNQCLTGDPTYYNTGNIVLGGNINVGENLAIIAGGNITTNQ